MAIMDLKKGSTDLGLADIPTIFQEKLTEHSDTVPSVVGLHNDSNTRKQTRSQKEIIRRPKQDRKSRLPS